MSVFKIGDKRVSAAEFAEHLRENKREVHPRIAKHVEHEQEAARAADAQRTPHKKGSKKQ